MATIGRIAVDLASFTANAGTYNSYSASAQTFNAEDKIGVAFIKGTLVSSSATMVANFQHSADATNWVTVHTFGLSPTASAAYNFELASAQPTPLLPYGRVTLGMTGGAGATQWNTIVARWFVSK